MRSGNGKINLKKVFKNGNTLDNIIPIKSASMANNAPAIAVQRININGSNK